MDELHGVLIEYEMRIEKERKPKGEEAFKASNKTKSREHKTSKNFNDESNEE